MKNYFSQRDLVVLMSKLEEFSAIVFVEFVRRDIISKNNFKQGVRGSVVLTVKIRLKSLYGFADIKKIVEEAISPFKADSLISAEYFLPGKRKDSWKRYRE